MTFQTWTKPAPKGYFPNTVSAGVTMGVTLLCAHLPCKSPCTSGQVPAWEATALLLIFHSGESKLVCCAQVLAFSQEQARSRSLATTY